MPIFTINTNVSRDEIPDDFLSTTANLVAEVLGKPISYVVVQVNPDQMLSWAGTSDPCAVASLGSIGSIGKSENKIVSKKLFAHVKENLGIKEDRMYINFANLEPYNVGYAGRTF